MTDIEVIDRDGGGHRVALAEAATLMEAIRDADVQSDFALCGGNCSCATCHVYIEGTTGLSPAEDEVLDGASHRRPASRLSCQLAVDSVPAGARIVIAPLD